MSRIMSGTLAIAIATGTAFVTLAGSAAADPAAHGRATLRGRQVSWQAPPAEKPFALTGQKAEDERTEPTPSGLQPRGRAGYARR